MQTNLAIYPQTTGERNLVLNIIYPQPISVPSLCRKGKYSIIPKQFRTVWTRNYEIASGPEGVNVFLEMRNNQHRLFQKDIVFCERELFRLVARQLASHQEPRKHREIRAHLRDLLRVQVSQDRVHGSKGQAQIHDLNPRQLSFDDTSRNLNQYNLRPVGNIF